MVEQDEEGEALLSQLLGVLEGDLPDEGRAPLHGPGVELVVVQQRAGVLLLPLTVPRLGRVSSSIVIIIVIFNVIVILATNIIIININVIIIIMLSLSP